MNKINFSTNINNLNNNEIISNNENLIFKIIKKINSAINESNSIELKLEDDRNEVHLISFQNLKQIIDKACSFHSEQEKEKCTQETFRKIKEDRVPLMKILLLKNSISTKLAISEENDEQQQEDREKYLKKLFKQIIPYQIVKKEVINSYSIRDHYEKRIPPIRFLGENNIDYIVDVYTNRFLYKYSKMNKEDYLSCIQCTALVVTLKTWDECLIYLRNIQEAVKNIVDFNLNIMNQREITFLSEIGWDVSVPDPSLS